MRTEAYLVNEIFYSLQGEGKRAGTANVFVRFARCNLVCAFCDTEFDSGFEIGLADLVNEIAGVGMGCRNVIFSGGEPALQLDEALVALLKGDGYHLAVETNGTKALPEGIDWVTVSPKTAEHTLKVKRCDELKYVRAAGHALPSPSIPADHLLISPMFDPDGQLARANLEHCIRLVKENPKWELSIQMHKLWRVR